MLLILKNTTTSSASEYTTYIQRRCVNPLHYKSLSLTQFKQVQVCRFVVEVFVILVQVWNWSCFTIPPSWYTSSPRINSNISNSSDGNGTSVNNDNC